MHHVVQLFKTAWNTNMVCNMVYNVLYDMVYNELDDMVYNVLYDVVYNATSASPLGMHY